MSYDFNRDMTQWADIEGERYPDKKWLLSSADTWHKNPHYKGERQSPPEEKKADVWLDPQDVPF